MKKLNLSLTYSSFHIYDIIFSKTYRIKLKVISRDFKLMIKLLNRFMSYLSKQLISCDLPHSNTLSFYHPLILNFHVPPLLFPDLLEKLMFAKPHFT